LREKPRSQKRDLGHPLNIRPRHFQAGAMWGTENDVPGPDM